MPKSGHNPNTALETGRIPRRRFLETVAAAGVGFPAIRRVAAAPGDPDLLAQARSQIEQHRKGPGVITVSGADGKRLAGCKIELEQTRHEFLFGCNFFMFGRTGSAETDELYSRRFGELFNYATLGFYWSSYEPVEGRPQYDSTARALDWCRQYDLVCKGHPLVWDHPASVPKWLPDSAREVGRLVEKRVSDCIQRFKGGIEIWDVVNEPTDLTRFKNSLNSWANSLGAVPYLKLNLKTARAANPAATLLVNDYRADVSFYRHLDDVRGNGKLLFDAVGLQSHMHDGTWPLSRIWAACSRFVDLKVPVHFTETTVLSGPRTGPGENWGSSTAQGEAQQADYVANFYTMLFAHPAARALTWWDFADLGAWRGAAAGLLRKDLSPKPAYEKLKALVRGEWWTRSNGVADATGQFRTSAFYGNYKLSIQTPDGKAFTRNLVWSRDSKREFEIAVA